MHQWPGRFLGITTGWDPSLCKSNRFHVHILRFSCIKLGYIQEIPLKWSVILLQSWTSTGYFSNSTGSFVSNCRFSPTIGLGVAINSMLQTFLSCIGSPIKRGLLTWWLQWNSIGDMTWAQSTKSSLFCSSCSFACSPFFCWHQRTCGGHHHHVWPTPHHHLRMHILRFPRSNFKLVNKEGWTQVARTTWFITTITKIMKFTLNHQTYSPPTLIGAGYQRTIPTSKGHF